MNKLRNKLMLLRSIVLCTVLVAVPARALVGEVLITFESVPGRDWVVDCAAQTTLHERLTSALNVLMQ